MSSAKPKRIALLVCDTPVPAVLANQGDYHAIFNTLLSASLPAGAPPFVLDPYDVVHKQAYPPTDSEYDGIVITGSGTLSVRTLENLAMR